jgi:endonuclease YncB( thermonuclease family)
MKKITKLGLGLAAVLYAARVFAVIYIWQDEQGVMHISDNLKQVPSELRDLLGANPEERKQAGSLGYWRDDRGNYHFYRLAPAEATPAKINYLEKTAYDPEKDILLRGKPNPEVLTATVEKILAPDMLLLSSGDKLRYTGIAFPPELGKDSPSFKAAMEYEKNLLEGKTIKVLFDTRKKDKDGNLLGQVFYGTNVFVNGDLVLKGFACQKIEPPNYEYLKLYRRLESHARKNQLGIWKDLQPK